MACLCMATAGCNRGRDSHLITSIGQMSRVPAHIESGSYPAQFQGWVTMPDKASNLLCVEDATGAVRVELIGSSESFQP